MQYRRQQSGMQIFGDGIEPFEPRKHTPPERFPSGPWRQAAAVTLPAAEGQQGHPPERKRIWPEVPPAA